MYKEVNSQFISLTLRRIEHDVEADDDYEEEDDIEEDDVEEDDVEKIVVQKKTITKIRCIRK